jgi:prophage DNA circulation protein
MSKIAMVKRLSQEQTEASRRAVTSTTEAQMLLIETLDRLATDQSRLTAEYRAAVTGLIETLTTSASAAEQMISGAHQEAQSVLLSSVAAVSKAEKAALKAEAILVSAQASMTDQSKAMADQSKALSRLLRDQTALTKSLKTCALVVVVSAVGLISVVAWLVWRVMHPV